MSIVDNALDRYNNDRVMAATAIAQSLASHDPADPLRAPYTPENAVLAVIDLFKIGPTADAGIPDLDDSEIAHVRRNMRLWAEREGITA